MTTSVRTSLSLLLRRAVTLRCPRCGAGGIWRTWFATLGDRVSFNVLWGASMALAVLMPIVFYPFSRELWLAFDLYFRPNESGDAHDG